MDSSHYQGGPTAQALRDITEALGDKMPGLSKTKLDTEIGKRIASFSNLDKPYGRSLIYLVRSGQKKPSPAFAHAVMAFAYSLDDVDPVRARSKPIEVNAVGDVMPGSLVLGDSKKCAYPPCSIPFVPTVPWQEHHSRDCQVKNYKLKQRAKNGHR